MGETLVDMAPLNCTVSGAAPTVGVAVATALGVR